MGVNPWHIPSFWSGQIELDKIHCYPIVHMHIVMMSFAKLVAVYCVEKAIPWGSYWDNYILIPWRSCGDNCFLILWGCCGDDCILIPWGSCGDDYSLIPWGISGNKCFLILW